jgi:hypothetical protein
MTPLCKAFAATFALGLALLPDLAAAQSPYPTYRGDRRYEDEYTTPTPRQGYTGWGSGPLLGYFCDYQRTPIRRCENGRCQVVAWNLRQYCY